MKIIDFERKGNVIRFYLGADDLENWYGDDWNDAPYEDNAGTVYDRFVTCYYDIVLPFDTDIFEPIDSHVCKDDMVARIVPCMVFVEENKGAFLTFEEVAKNNRNFKVYFGDDIQKVQDYLIKLNEL